MLSLGSLLSNSHALFLIVLLFRFPVHSSQPNRNGLLASYLKLAAIYVPQLLSYRSRVLDTPKPDASLFDGFYCPSSSCTVAIYLTLLVASSHVLHLAPITSDRPPGRAQASI